jgi:hypothetical protein
MLVLANYIFTELGSLFNSYVELTLIKSWLLLPFAFCL